MGVFLDEANSFYSNLHPNPDYTFLLFFRIEVYIFAFYLSQNDVFDEASQMSIPYLNFLHHQQYWKPFGILGCIRQFKNCIALLGYCNSNICCFWTNHVLYQQLCMHHKQFLLHAHPLLVLHLEHLVLQVRLHLSKYQQHPSEWVRCKMKQCQMLNLPHQKMYLENAQYYLFQKQGCCGNRYTDSGLVDHYCYLQRIS